LTVVRYLIAAVLVLAGLVWIGQGLGFIPGSFMSAQPIWAIIGAVLVVGGVALAWTTRRRSTAR
jgi:hypothetical protein